MSEVSLLFPKYIEGGLPSFRAVAFRGGSYRLRSAVEEPFDGMSANIDSLASCVDAEDFRGHVPYHEFLDFNCKKLGRRGQR